LVVGAGGEWAVNRNWSIKSEYLYSRISAATGTGSVFLADGTTAFVAHSTGTISESSIRLGFNYKY
jgi:opacity protein-like surface antigen